MNKKASSIILMIFEILAVILVIFIMVSVAKAYGSSDLVLRANTAEDVQMMVNTLAGVPGDAVVSYPKNVSAFSMILGQNGISVFKKGEAEHLWETRTFYLPEGYTAEGVVSEKDTFCLEKKNKKVILRECLAEEVKNDSEL